MKTSTQTILYVTLSVLGGIIVGLAFPSRQMPPTHAVAPGTSQTPTVAQHPHDHAETDHIHDQYILPEDSVSSPTLELIGSLDSMGGINLELKTQNFIFSPQEAGLDHVDNHGHAHLYINGEKFGRIYGTWFHVPTFLLNPNSTNTICVTLNTNTHSEYAIHGESIESCVAL